MGFPSGEGIEGCVTVRSAVWAEVFLLLFGRGGVSRFFRPIARSSCLYDEMIINFRTLE